MATPAFSILRNAMSSPYFVREFDASARTCVSYRSFSIGRTAKSTQTSQNPGVKNPPDLLCASRHLRSSHAKGSCHDFAGRRVPACEGALAAATDRRPSKLARARLRRLRIPSRRLAILISKHELKRGVGCPSRKGLPDIQGVDRARLPEQEVQLRPLK
jgi:hypothetical protein